MTASRRTFLKLGSAAAAGLLLPVMRSARAFGQTTAAPRRLVFFHSPLGTVRDQWLPTGSGASYTLSPILQPLQTWKSQLLVVDGMHFTPDPDDAGNGAGNHHEPGTMLTGKTCNGRDELSKHSNISLDQFIKAKLPSTVAVKSLELMTFYSNPLLRADRNLFSASGPNLPVVPEADPQKAFDRVFGGFSAPTGTGGSTEAEAIRLKRLSVLDAVSKELTGMQPRLSATERLKLDQHLTAIRELEKRLQTPATTGGMCTLPGKPTAVNPYDNDTIPGRLRAHMDIVVAAMACDRIRVAVIGSENGQGRAKPTWIGLGTNWHDSYTHNSTGKVEHAKVHNWYVQQFAYLIGKFASIPEGAGTMLDNTAIVMFSEQGCRFFGSSPTEHSRVDLPYMVAGSCGGYFKVGTFQTLSQRSHKDFLFNCLRAMGYPDTSMGKVSGTPIAELAV
jgi:hypothetical protein